MTAIDKILQVSDLSIGYKKDKETDIIFSGIDFNVLRGEMVSLLGPNGSGKSTLLRSLSSVQPFFSGEILINGTPLVSFSDSCLARIISIVLTDRHFAGGLTVYELVSLGRSPYTGFFGRLNSDDHRIVSESLSLTGIDHKKESFYADLSDGEKQKVMIAKALAQQTDIILLDEPTSFLDITSKIEIMSLLRDLAMNEKKTILLSTHDINQAISFSDKLILIHKDYGLRYGSPEMLIINGDINKYFSHNNIKFNTQSGHFIKSDIPIYEINVVSDIKESYAINQMFSRLNILITNKETDYKIIIKSPDNITVMHKGNCINSYGNIDELNKWLSSFIQQKQHEIIP